MAVSRSKPELKELLPPNQIHQDKKYPAEKEYGAKSQLYIGLCYEKMGRQEAQKAFQKVIDNYPEQTEAVKLANKKLSFLLSAKTIIREEDKEFSIRQVWAGRG